MREAANRVKCQNNFKQAGLAAHNYHSTNGCFPPGTLNPYCADDSTSDDNRDWFHFMLPYVEQDGLYRALENYWTGGGNMGFLYSMGPICATIVPTFVCPSDPHSPKIVTYMSDQQGFHGNVAGCAGNTTFNTSGCSGSQLNGVFFWKSAVAVTQIPDGSSNTLLFGEIRVSPDVTTHDTRGRYWNNAFQGSVIFSTLDPPNTSVNDILQWCQSIPGAPCQAGTSNIVQSARSAHTGGVNVCLADGSVRFVSNSIDPVTWAALGTRSGGEVLADY